MNTCVKCGGTLPDQAGHCVFCGTKQSAASTPSKASPTMMGHPGLIDELAKTLEDSKRPNFSGPATIESSPPSQADLNYVSKLAATRLATSDAEASALRALIDAPTAPITPIIQPALPNSQSPVPTSPPVNVLSPAPAQSPALPPMAIPGQHPQVSAASVAAQPLTSPFDDKHFGINDAQFGDAAKRTVPSPVAYQDSLTEKVVPLPAPVQEPLHSFASQWDESLATVLLVFGVLLIACFIAPWSVASEQSNTLFSWSVYSVEGAPLRAKLLPAMIVGVGLISILIGAFRIKASMRALVATCIGLFPLVFQIVSAKPLEWQSLVFSVGTILIFTGMLLRSRHTRAMFPKVLTSIGAIALLLLYCIPQNETILIQVLLELVTEAKGTAKVMALGGVNGNGYVVGIFPFICILLSFLVWIPSSNTVVIKVLAVLILFGELIAGVCVLAFFWKSFLSLPNNLSTSIFLPLAKAAWIAITSYGLCGLIHSKLSSQ